MSRLLITGGHLTPALGLIDYLQKARPEVKIVFLGRELAQIGTGQKSWEKSEILARRLSFIPFEAQKTGSFNPVTFPQTIKNAQAILQRNKISHVLSFGGYLALPVAIAAKGLNLPVITHEQTRVLGRANRAISIFASQTALSFADTKLPIYVRRTVVTGNPLRPQLFLESAAPSWFKPEKQLPILYVAGGSQGSQALNELIWSILSPLLQEYVIVHQVGRASQVRNPLVQAQSIARSQALANRRYFAREFLSVQELAYFYPRLHLAVSRSGANTVAELTAFRVPTLYLPLPQANYHEQELNAQALAKIGAARCCRQKDLVPVGLLAEIQTLAQQRILIEEKLQTLPSDQGAAERLTNLFNFADDDNVAIETLRQAKI